MKRKGFTPFRNTKNRKPVMGFLTGFTLIEILIASAILAGVFTTVWLVYIRSLSLTEEARNRTIAVNDLQDMMEEIRATNFTAITNNFPNGIQDGGVVNDYEAIVSGTNGYLLINEHITITYPGGATNDPLQIVVTLGYEEKGGGAKNLSFRTLRTRVQ